MAISVLCLLFFNEYGTIIMIFDILLLMSIGVFDEEESFTDVAAVFLMSMLIGYALHFMLSIQEYNKWMLAYVIIVSYVCDSFAYLIGVKFGKHKLHSRVSPKKTIEGSWIWKLQGCRSGIFPNE